MFEAKPDYLEVFRHFRMNYFNSVDEFYINFYKVLNNDLNEFFKKNEDVIKNTKRKNT